MEPARRLARPLLLAAGLLTVVRVPVRGDVDPAELRASASAYPLVGLLVGAVPAAALLLPLPPLPRAVLAVALWSAMSGALHLDGWADCCDAAFVPARADAEATRERRLEILKDPRAGSFGVAGLALLLLGKVAALAYAPAAAPLVAAPVARWGMVYTLRAYPRARPGGLAAAMGGLVPIALPTLLALAIVAAVAASSASPLRVLAAAAAGAATAATIAAFLARRFGGVTGDVCGAAGEGAELAALWTFLPWGA